MPLAAERLCVREVTTAAALEALRPEWAELWRADTQATPFQSPEWLIPWWRHIGEGDLWTLAVRDAESGRLLGLAPLYVYTQPHNGERALFPLGIATTDYLDALFRPGREAEVMAAVFAHLEARADRWDVCDWQQLRPGSPLLECPTPPGWSEERGEQDSCPFLPLPATEDGLGAHVPGRMLDNLRYYQRRAEKAGSVHIDAATPENRDELFDALLSLHGARWSSRGEAGVLAEENVCRAHRESLPGLLALGALRLYALRLDGRIVAAFYGFADPPGRPRRRVYYYLGGFDPEFERLSPGTLLIGHALREAVRDGAAEFDMLRGREPYKYLWGAKDRWTRCRRLRANEGGRAEPIR